MICAACQKDAAMLFPPVSAPVCYSCAPWPKPSELDAVAFEDVDWRPTEASYASALPVERDLENHRMREMDAAWLRGEI